MNTISKPPRTLLVFSIELRLWGRDLARSLWELHLVWPTLYLGRDPLTHGRYPIWGSYLTEPVGNTSEMLIVQAIIHKAPTIVHCHGQGDFTHAAFGIYLIPPTTYPMVLLNGREQCRSKYCRSGSYTARVTEMKKSRCERQNRGRDESKPSTITTKTLKTTSFKAFPPRWINELCAASARRHRCSSKRCRCNPGPCTAA